MLAMSREPAAKSGKSLRYVVIAITSVSVLFAIGLGVFIFFMVRPQGERVGQTNLGDSNASLTVAAQRGDSLSFRVDASVALPRLALVSDDVLERQASTQLSRSLLTVRATAPSGKERSTRCAVYKGRAMSTTVTSGRFSRAGMLNDCVILVDEPGPWQVRGTVAWTADLSVQSALLETRVQHAAR
jgi:hypothetical protein